MIEFQRFVSAKALLRYTIAAGALAWVVTTLDWRRSLVLMLDIPLPILGGILSVSILAFISRAWLWVSLLNHFGEVSISDVLQADLVVKFVNSFFPSRFSGQSIAPVALRHFTGMEWANVTAVVVANTALYAVFYGVFSLIGLVILFPAFPIELVAFVALSVSLYLAVGVVLFAGGWNLQVVKHFLEWVTPYFDYVPFFGNYMIAIVTSVTSGMDESAEGFRAIVRDTNAVLGFAGSLLLTLGVLNGVRVYLLIVGMGGSPETPWLLPLYVVTAYAVTILPLSPGGIGVTEATSILVFSSIGYPTEVIVPAVFLDRILGAYLPALAGWYPTASIDIGEYLSTTE